MWSRACSNEPNVLGRLRDAHCRPIRRQPHRPVQCQLARDRLRGPVRLSPSSRQAQEARAAFGEPDPLQQRERTRTRSAASRPRASDRRAEAARPECHGPARPAQQQQQRKKEQAGAFGAGQASGTPPAHRQGCQCARRQAAHSSRSRFSASAVAVAAALREASLAIGELELLRSLPGVDLGRVEIALQSRSPDCAPSGTRRHSGRCARRSRGSRAPPVQLSTCWLVPSALYRQLCGRSVEVSRSHTEPGPRVSARMYFS